MSDNIEVLARLLAQSGASCVYNGASVNPYGVGYQTYDELGADMQGKLKMQALWLSEWLREAGGRTSAAQPSRQDLSAKNGIPGKRKSRVIKIE